LNIIEKLFYENLPSAIYPQCNILCDYLHNMPNADHAQQNNKLLIQINSRFNETIKAFHIARNDKTDTDAYKVRVPFQGKRILPVANVRGRQCTHFPSR